jgi:hypothetical protein
MGQTIEQLRDALRGVSDASTQAFAIYRDIVSAEAQYLENIFPGRVAGRMDNASRFIMIAQDHLEVGGEGRRWGDTPFTSWDVSDVSTEGDGVRLKLKDRPHHDDDYVVEHMTIPAALYDAYGTEGFSAVLEAFMKERIAPIQEEFDESRRTAEERHAANLIAAEEKERAEFARLSEKFGK